MCRGLVRWSLLFFACGSGVIACWNGNRADEVVCADDLGCTEGAVCRMARCHKTCPGEHWVGEDVSVHKPSAAREATVTGCDDAIRVRYPSGIEERVDAKLVHAVEESQARAVTDKTR